MRLLWQAWRGTSTSTLDQCMSSGHDLGSASHVNKVLLKTFSGATTETDAITWRWKGIAVSARPETTARPRFIDFLIELPSLMESNEAIVKLSPRFRRLQDDRAWAVFDLSNSQQLLLAPPKPPPRRKKGLISMMIGPEDLLRQIEAKGQTQWLVLGGLESIAAMDKFLSNIPPPEFTVGMNVAFGWSNLEICVPEGVRFYPIWFRGAAAKELHAWYSQKAEADGLSLGLFAGKALIAAHSARWQFQLEDCHLIAHGIRESSVATRQ